MNAKKAINDGTGKPCLCVDLVKAQENEKFSDDLAGYTSGSLLEANSDATAATLNDFVQAMVVFPDVQKKAQEEIDRVVDPDRLTGMEDLPQTQCIRSCVKESLRWMPTNIPGVPSAIKNEGYVGYRTSAGSSIINNVWAIHTDSKRRPNPRAFDPARYAKDFQSEYDAATNPDVSKRDQFVFVAGRRLRHGMHNAERSMFLAIARTFLAFDITEAFDMQGNAITPTIDRLTRGLFVQPAPITPRREKHASIIRSEWQECKDTLLGKVTEEGKKVPEGMVFTTYIPSKEDAHF